MVHIKPVTFALLILGLLLTACGGTAPAQGPVNVDVTLKEFTIESSVAQFQPGVPYHFRITNNGQAAHEFTMVPVTVHGVDMPNVASMSMDERNKAGLLLIPVQQIAPGATVEVDYTFSTVSKGDTIELVCTQPGHWEAGMHIQVPVQ